MDSHDAPNSVTESKHAPTSPVATSEADLNRFTRHWNRKVKHPKYGDISVTSLSLLDPTQRINDYCEEMTKGNVTPLWVELRDDSTTQTAGSKSSGQAHEIIS